MDLPEISEKERLDSLNYPDSRVKMVLDTDTYNEVDDQFALAYALNSQASMEVEAVYAAPFHNPRSESPEDGMEKSYQEILQVMDRLGLKNEEKVFKGSTDYISDYDAPESSEAAADLIEKALALPEGEKLYVGAIGAITNIASAILIEPKIIKKIVILWLGGHAHFWPDTEEFNLAQDVLASRLIFDSGVPLIQVPCMGVASHLQTTIPELEKYLGSSDIGQYLINIVANHTDDTYGWSKVIWDISVIGYLINRDWFKTNLVHSPILTDQVTWSFDNARHFIKTVEQIDRDGIFTDLFQKLS